MESQLETEAPDISVLMTVYNGEEYIEQSIDSLRAQPFEKFELIIVDDGSTDSTSEIIAKFAKLDGRIKSISQSNQGIAAAANAGISVARGKYLAILDHDDLARPEWLQSAKDALDSRPNLVAVGGNYDLIDYKSRYLTTIRQTRGNDSLQALALGGTCPLTHPGSMMRMSSVIAVGCYRREYEPAQDLDLFLRLGELGELDNLDLVTVRYRLHSKSTSERKAAAQREKAQAACEDAWARRNVKGKFEASRGWRHDGTSSADHVFALQYGWWAFNSSENRTALSYGLRAIRLKPLDRKGWQLTVAAIRKRAPVAGR